MRKILLLIISLIFIFLTTSCVQDPENPTYEGDGIQYLTLENRTGSSIKLLYPEKSVACLNPLPFVVDDTKSNEFVFFSKENNFNYYIEYMDKIYMVHLFTDYPIYNSTSVYFFTKDSELYVHDNRTKCNQIIKEIETQD